MSGFMHLEFYKKHAISPVRYDETKLDEHLRRRKSLYRSLGLTPLAIKNSSILEVAAGSGQNSLYVSATQPASLTLLEPNPVAFSQICELYSNINFEHTVPKVINSTLQDFDSDKVFDVIICENWLGNSREELALLRKIGNLVKSNGLIILTTISVVGLLPNLIRRALTVKFVDREYPFEQQTKIADEMFRPHLSTINGMTRNSKDWVQDNMLNPAYFGINLSVREVVSEIGESFTYQGSSPSFVSDWRWFKSLYGDNCKFNENLLHQYESNLHNFLDYELEFTNINTEANKKLDLLCAEFLDAVCRCERSDETKAKYLNSAVEVLQKIMLETSEFPSQITEGLDAALDLLLSDTVDHRVVAMKSPFTRLFGKETVYVSFERQQGDR